jgi:hypothetical protein
MNQIFTLFTAGVLCLSLNSSFAQYSENFDGAMSSITGNCWEFVEMNHSSDGTITPISGAGSLYSEPPTSGSSTRDISTPYLNISTSLQVSFKYKLSSTLNGNATRTIEVGLTDSSGNFTSLQTITLNKFSPATTQTFNNTFTLAAASVQRLTIRLGGNTGDGNSRLIFDDLSTNASPYYGASTSCNTAPVAVNDTYNGITGNQVSGNVMLNDNDPNGEILRSSIVTASPDGTVVMNADGTFTFTPNAGFTGSSTTFTYQLTDNGYDHTNSNIATVTINYTVGGALPLKLTSFQGKMNDGRVSLRWDLAENKNAQRFEIERSFNGTDFSLVGIVMASDNSGRESYSFVNDISSNPKVMYRLKTIDNSNIAEYSKILLFQQDNAQNLKIINNPVYDNLTLSYSSTSNQSICIKVYDMLSRLHMNYKATVYTGVNVISFPLAPGIRSGIYVVEINDGANFSKSAKFVKQ